MNYKINTKTAIYLLIISVFVFGFSIRNICFNGIFQYVDIFAIVGIILFLLFNQERKNIKNIIIFFLFSLTVIFTNYINNVSISKMLLYIFLNVVPIGITLISWNKIKIDEQSLRNIIKFFNVFVFLIFLIYIVDVISGSVVMRYITNNYIISLKNLIPPVGVSLFNYRYASYLGHYLYTDFVYLCFFAINTAYNLKKNNNKVCSQWLINIISIIGVISTGSKTGLILLVLSFIILYIKEIKNVIIMMFGVMVLNFLGFFNIIFNRLATEQFSTGRFDTWKLFFESNYYKFKLIGGYGDNLLNNLISTFDLGVAGILQEFPLPIIALKYGIIAAIMFIFLTFIYPYKQLKTKNIKFLILIFILFVCINVYNGLLVMPDVLILYEFTVMIIVIINNMKFTKK